MHYLVYSYPKSEASRDRANKAAGAIESHGARPRHSAAAAFAGLPHGTVGVVLACDNGREPIEAAAKKANVPFLPLAASGSVAAQVARMFGEEVEEPSPPPSPGDVGSDFASLEGLTPTMHAKLVEGGIENLAQLIDTPADRLREILPKSKRGDKALQAILAYRNEEPPAEGGEP
jgi:hypothetical protein